MRLPVWAVSMRALQTLATHEGPRVPSHVIPQHWFNWTCGSMSRITLLPEEGEAGALEAWCRCMSVDEFHPRVVLHNTEGLKVSSKFDGIEVHPVFDADRRWHMFDRLRLPDRCFEGLWNSERRKKIRTVLPLVRAFGDALPGWFDTNIPSALVMYPWLDRYLVLRYQVVLGRENFDWDMVADSDLRNGGFIPMTTMPCCGITVDKSGSPTTIGLLPPDFAWDPDQSVRRRLVSLL